jgi:hypothetical protein
MSEEGTPVKDMPEAVFRARQPKVSDLTLSPKNQARAKAEDGWSVVELHPLFQKIAHAIMA